MLPTCILEKGGLTIALFECLVQVTIVRSGPNFHQNEESSSNNLVSMMSFELLKWKMLPKIHSIHICTAYVGDAIWMLSLS